MKDIYEFLNYVEIDLKEYDKTDLNDIDKKKIKKRLHRYTEKNIYNLKKFVKNACISFAVLFLACIIIFNVKPTFAREIPLLGNIIKNFEDRDNGEFDTYTSVINKSIEKNGIKVTLNEVAIDDNRFIIAATFKTGYKFYEKSFPTVNPTITVNGKWLNGSGGKDSKIVNNAAYTTYTTVDTIDIPDNMNIPDNMHVKISYADFNAVSPDSKKSRVIKGPWDFNFTVSKKKIMNSTKIVKINKRIKWYNIDTEIKQINVTPLSTKILFDYTYNISPNRKYTNPLDFIITDNRGNYLRWKGSELMPNKNTVNYADKDDMSFELFSGMPKDSKKMYITPYYATHNPRYLEPLKVTGNFPIVLKQDEDNRLIVYGITRRDGKVYAKYRCEGNLGLDIQLGRLYLYDSNKKMLDDEDSGGDYKNVSSNRDIITKVFKDRDKGEIYVGTTDMSDIKLLEDSKFTIDLDNN
ncbi:MAG: DUF4179 domain-containing protein [Clostridium sp.]|jgi:hypothetical protein|uniref:DUF4179 domain-containing protein n=1 Tax=Clostridium sp. TaxID=1506 RepID=UPI0025B873D8|nr:DUF4179 domain-containing protein [Clostridium sp.]MCH3964436.1 DUF4179 domain-containing protein [Clostridium sp.]MCI1715611.1 DUF4179 domain-containing protein [Clostridium sp.]MCI1799597.1 DUF4179 domain-containing protein [Clostridium sp.]MCI1813795.1 DUF4179 domain-containing protein [Clostridium sp.]MCI1870410.1 DUF4179 domain-containing protein [Clostridium sp.]